jgi:hypothetical protein
MLLGNVEAYTWIFSGAVYTYTALVLLTGRAILIVSLPPPKRTGTTTPVHA